MMKDFFKKLIESISNVVANVIAYGGALWIMWWLFDEEIVQVTDWLIDTLDRIF